MEPYAPVWKDGHPVRVKITHARTIDATQEEVGRLVAALGGERDVLWPNDLWPGTELEFDRPLGPGARGGHGAVRYTVEAYEPDRFVVFRFEPGSGLDGFHRFDIEPLACGRTRLRHTLGTRLEGAVRLTRPLLERMHDTLIRQTLDNAQLVAGGQVYRPTRMALWMRAMNAVEARLVAERGRPGRGARLAGVAVPAAFVGLAGLHAGWALGWRWPGGSDDAFAERVVSNGDLPPEWATWAVAGLLLAAAATVRAVARGVEGPLVRAGAWTIATVLVARGTGFFVYDVAKGFDTVYTRLDAAIYSPLSLALGLGAGLAARRGAGGRAPATS
jgi:hypothetical protein